MKTIKSSSGKEYKISDKSGMAYHINTPDKVVDTIDSLYVSKKRIRIDYGTIATKESWGETYDVTGTIGRSTGTIKIPLLINNARSIGGTGILTHCILSISHSNKKNGGYIYNLL